MTKDMYDTTKYYHHKPEVWDAKRCEKAARHVAKDGLGTKYPFPGYIGSSTAYPYTTSHYGTVRYNGGCIREGKHYWGEIHPLPIVAKGFKIIDVPAWGYRIVKEDEQPAP